MTPEEKELLRNIAATLDLLVRSDRYTIQKTVQIFDGRDFQFAKATGSKIGTSALEKIGFYGVAPVIQPSTIGDPSGAGDAGVDQPARDAAIAIIDRLQELGLVA